MVFFHSLPVPKLREWVFSIPFPFPNFGNGIIHSCSRSRTPKCHSRLPLVGKDFPSTLPQRLRFEIIWVRFPQVILISITNFFGTPVRVRRCGTSHSNLCGSTAWTPNRDAMSIPKTPCLGLRTFFGNGCAFIVYLYIVKSYDPIKFWPDNPHCNYIVKLYKSQT